LPPLQCAMRQLGYFNITGRLRLAISLARVTLEIPMVLDRAMIEDGTTHAAQQGTRASAANSEDSHEDSSHEANPGGSKPRELQRRGFLPLRVKGALVLTCKMLEKGERLGL